MAPGCREGLTGNEQVRAGEIVRIDGFFQGDIDKFVRAHDAAGGKTRLEGSARVNMSIHGFIDG